MSELHYEVLVNDGVRRHREQTLPDGSPIVSSPIASTLIYGERDAVLVDPPFTYEQVRRVGDWIERSGKHLTAVYATHGHGDHWFGTDLLLQRFPDAVAYATDGTIAMMHQQGTDGRAEMWDVDFPGQIPPSPVVYQPIPADGIELEGHRLLAVEVGHTDTDDTTVLHVPSIGLVVAGDVAYNGVHQYLLESAHGGVEAWLAALDKVAALQPRAVVAGHKNKDLPDDPAILDADPRIPADARRLLAEKLSPREYFDEMIALYPDRLNVGPVWYTAVALLSEPRVTPRFVTRSRTGSSTTICPPGSASAPERSSAGPSSSSTTGPRRCTGATTRAAGGSWMRPPSWRSCSSCKADCGRGYAYTAVPDRKVTVYHDNGAAIEVIWSRRRADGTEIERMAAHFEVARGSAGWRIIGIQANHQRLTESYGLSIETTASLRRQQ